MACRHRAAAAASSSSCCCCSCSHTCSPPAPPPASDPLLHALLAQLLRSQSQQFQPYAHHHPTPKPHLHGRYRHEEEEVVIEDRRRTSLLHSLIQRVASLESSLPDLPKPSLRSPPSAPSRAFLVRDSAARVIQSHFRLFLVKRSQTLRALRCLSSLRSRLLALQSSLPGGEPRALCHQAADLLLHLDSIQNGDPLVHREKIAISQEIAGIVEALERIPAQIRRPRQVSPLLVMPQKLQKVVLEEQVDIGNDVSCDGSSRISSECEEEGNVVEGVVQEGGGALGKIGGGRGNNYARPLGLAAPLPLKMETRSSSRSGGLLGTMQY